MVRGPNFRIVLFWVRDEREGPIAVKDRRLGTDRRRSRQWTATIGVFGFATFQGVRHALADIKRARLSELFGSYLPSPPRVITIDFARHSAGLFAGDH